MIATLDLIAISDTGTDLVLTVTAYTKNREDSGSGVKTDTGDTTEIQVTSVSTLGRYDEEWDGASLTNGLLELVRFRFAVTVGQSASDFVLFRMLPTVWADAVKA